jgi:hypothetical protein
MSESSSSSRFNRLTNWIGMKLLSVFFTLFSLAFAQYYDPLVGLLQPAIPPANLYTIRGPIYVEPSSLKPSFYDAAPAFAPAIYDNTPTLIGPPVYDNSPALIGPPVYDNSPALIGPPVYDNSPALIGPPVYDNTPAIVGPPVYDNTPTFEAPVIRLPSQLLVQAPAYEPGRYGGPIIEPAYDVSGIRYGPQIDPAYETRPQLFSPSYEFSQVNLAPVNEMNPIYWPPSYESPSFYLPPTVGTPLMEGPTLLGPPVAEQTIVGPPTYDPLAAPALSPSPYNPYLPNLPAQIQLFDENDVSPTRRFNTNSQSGISQFGVGNMNLQGNIQQVNSRRSSQGAADQVS